MRHELDYLADIVEYADEILSSLDGISLDAFVNDDLLRSATTYKLIIIGEAAARISEETRQRFSDAY